MKLMFPQKNKPPPTTAQRAKELKDKGNTAYQKKLWNEVRDKTMVTSRLSSC